MVAAFFNGGIVIKAEEGSKQNLLAIFDGSYEVKDFRIGLPSKCLRTVNVHSGKQVPAEQKSVKVTVSVMAQWLWNRPFDPKWHKEPELLRYIHPLPHADRPGFPQK